MFAPPSPKPIVTFVLGTLWGRALFSGVGQTLVASLPDCEVTLLANSVQSADKSCHSRSLGRSNHGPAFLLVLLLLDVECCGAAPTIQWKSLPMFEWYLPRERSIISDIKSISGIQRADSDEHVAICATVRRNLRSRGYSRGRYRVRQEIGVYAFHRRNSEFMRSAWMAENHHFWPRSAKSPEIFTSTCVAPQLDD